MKTILTVALIAMTQMLSAQFLNPSLDNWNEASGSFPFERPVGWRTTNDIVIIPNITVYRKVENDRIFARIESNRNGTDATGSGYLEQEITTANLKSITYESRCDSIDLLGGCIIQILDIDKRVLLADTTVVESETFSQKTLIVPAQLIEGRTSIFVRFQAQGHKFFYPEPELDGYTLFDVDNVIADFSTSTDEQILDDTLLDVYPNPSSGIIHLDLSGDLQAESLKVFNSLGQIAWSGEYTDRIDLSQLENGNYIISIQTETGIVSKNVSILK